MADRGRGGFWRRLFGRDDDATSARRVVLRDGRPPGLFDPDDDEWLVPRDCADDDAERAPAPRRRPPGRPASGRVTRAVALRADGEEDGEPATGFGRFLRFGNAARGGWQTRTVMSAAGIVAAGFILSRLLGLVRSVAIANAFGTQPDLAAYFVAFRLPDLVFQLLAGGTVSAAFIPVFSRVSLERGDEGAWRLASSVLNLLSIATGVLALVAFVLAPHLVPLLAPGLGDGTGRQPELTALAVKLTRFMLLSPMFFGISGLMTGILNARQHFVAPALAPVFYNLSIIVGAVLLSGPLGVWGLAWGVVIGSALHLVVQVPVVFLLGMRWTGSLGVRSRAVRDVMRLMGPRVIGLAATQANFLVLIFFASFISDAAISAINFAFLVMMMPVGVVGMAISTAAFPTLSRQAAAGQMGPLRESLASALRVILFLAVPASVGLVVLAQPAVRLLFQHGAFDAESTALVTEALTVFAIAIAAHSGIEILSRGFYALSDTKTPVQLSVMAMALNLVLSAVLVRPLGLRGLAGATSVAAIFECSMLAYVLRERIGHFGARGVWRSMSRTVVATAVMAEVLVVVRLVLGARGLDAGSTLGALAIVVLGGLAGVVSYAAASWVVNREVIESVLGRLGGGS